MTCDVPHSRPWIEPSDRAAVEQALCSQMIARGARVQIFEEMLAQKLNVLRAISCSSGTSALLMALKTLNISSGDEVVIPTYVCASVLRAITSVGATPRMCDVDDNGVITLDTVTPALRPQTRAIVAVHIFGHPCDIISLNSLNIPIIEDACQAFGLKINQKLAGTLGTLGILSFHATKCLTTGEGGALIINDQHWLKEAQSLTGSFQPNNASGITAFTDMQAALGLSQLNRYTDFLQRRFTIFKRYHEIARALQFATVRYEGCPDFLFRFTLQTKIPFEDAQSAFLSLGIHTRRGVDALLHRQFDLNDDGFPNSVTLFNRTISLPFHPSLSDVEQNRVMFAMQEVFGGY